jgi:hypothetical protein
MCSDKGKADKTEYPLAGVEYAVQCMCGKLAFCIVTGFGFLAGAPLVSQFCTAPVFDLARRRHALVACRTLIFGSGI